jgi:hypothetical protein
MIERAIPSPRPIQAMMDRLSDISACETDLAA